MAEKDVASQLAFETHAIRNESLWLKEQATRVAGNMDRAWPVMRQARERIRALESALTAIESARPHHYQMAFEDHASFAQRLKAMARAALSVQPVA